MTLLQAVVIGLVGPRHVEAALYSDGSELSAEGLIAQTIGDIECTNALGMLLLHSREPITVESQDGKSEDDVTLLEPDDDRDIIEGRVYPIFNALMYNDIPLVWIYLLPVVVETFLASLPCELFDEACEVARRLIRYRKNTSDFFDDEDEAWARLDLYDEREEGDGSE